MKNKKTIKAWALLCPPLGIMLGEIKATKKELDVKPSNKLFKVVKVQIIIED